MTNPKVHFVSLGCPKNRVDLRSCLGTFKMRLFAFTHEAEQADVIVVNTCGFIEDAKQESKNTILEMARQKDEGQCKKLIVTGCLVERYSEELRKRFQR